MWYTLNVGYVFYTLYSSVEKELADNRFSESVAKSKIDNQASELRDAMKERDAQRTKIEILEQAVEILVLFGLFIQFCYSMNILFCMNHFVFSVQETRRIPGQGWLDDG